MKLHFIATKWVQKVGQHSLSSLAQLGSALILLLKSIFTIPTPFILKQIVKQLYNLGVLSLLIIILSALFIGLVLGLQGYTILSKYGSIGVIGQFIALTLFRELSPVVAGLLFAGRAGTAITAEIGLMKTTSQIDAFEVMGLNPYSNIIYPRFIAGFIALPLLTIIFSFFGIYGGKVIVVDWLGVYSGTFWNGIQFSVDFYSDVLSGMIKSVVFAFLISWVAVYQGFNSIPTSEGLSRATTKTVVYSSLVILGFDFILTAILFGDI